MTGNLAGWLIGATILVITCTGCSATQPVSWLPRCYAATGHTVAGDFLRTFDAMGGQRSLGYPITQPFVQEGRLVQYFESARLEDHPDNPGGGIVKLSMLGESLGRRRPPLDTRGVPPASDHTSRYYPELGHAISGEFLAFFDANGGLDRFGLPIAEPLVADGRLVQDFQRVRLIWHARAEGGERVTLERSGRAYFEWQGLDETLLAPAALSACVPAQAGCPPDAQVVQGIGETGA